MRRWIRKWTRLWGCPELGQIARVSFDRSLKRSLGRARLARDEVILHESLRMAPDEVLREVLCHEMAHLATHRLHGAAVRPHGAEWRDLVSAAGYPPRARAELGIPIPGVRGRPRARDWEHRCPVCQSVRFAGRPMGQWRCAECLDAGLCGDLIITSRAKGEEAL